MDGEQWLNFRENMRYFRFIRGITGKEMAAVVLVLCGLTLVSHGVDAVEQEEKPCKMVARVVQPGQSLWDICSRLDSSEDIRTIIDRTRVENDITDPGALQPGRVITIRFKK